MKRVIGIGGVFFTARDPEKLMAWYRKHLGMSARGSTAVFSWNKRKANRPGYTVLNIEPRKTKYFAPAKREFMLNFRVESIAKIARQLRRERVRILGDIVVEPQGKFLWIMDPEGTKIELWEPGGQYQWKEAVEME